MNFWDVTLTCLFISLSNVIFPSLQYCERHHIYHDEPYNAILSLIYLFCLCYKSIHNQIKCHGYQHLKLAPIYFSDVTWALLSLKPPALDCLSNCLFRLINYRTHIEALYYWPFVRWICRRPVDIPSQTRADSRFTPSQWETALLCNDVSHWLGASLESALQTARPIMRQRFPGPDVAMTDPASAIWSIVAHMCDDYKPTDYGRQLIKRRLSQCPVINN